MTLPYSTQDLKIKFANKNCVPNRPHPVCASMNNHLKIIVFVTWVYFEFKWSIKFINYWDTNHEAFSPWNNKDFSGNYSPTFLKALYCGSNQYMVLPGIALEYKVRKCILKTLIYILFSNRNTYYWFPLYKHFYYHNHTFPTKIFNLAFPAYHL